MKIAARVIDGFIKKPPPEARAILLYGPDEGLARERADIAAKTVVADIRDPFNVAEFSANELSANPSRLIDEAKAISMLGGRRVVRVHTAGDEIAAIVDAALEVLADGDALVLIVAGDLSPRSALRKLFEDAKEAAAIPCYVEDERDIGRVIGDALRTSGYSIVPEAIAHMSQNVVGDRGIARSEVEKLITYMGEEKKSVTLDDVIACVGNSASLSLENLSKSVASGNLREAERVLASVLSEGLPPVTILRNLQTYFTRLHATKTRIQQGEETGAAMMKLRPPVFFKVKAAFESQLNGWSLPQLEQALNVLVSAEAKCKQSANDPVTMCGRAVLTLSQVGARAVRR